MNLPNKKKITKKIQLKKTVDQLDLSQKDNLHAIAVKYNVSKDKAPKIVASGKAKVAEMILDLAEEHRVPMYEDPILSNLLSKLNINQSIPPTLYAVVAEVLSFAYQLEKLASKKSQIKQKIKQKKSL